MTESAGLKRAAIAVLANLRPSAIRWRWAQASFPEEGLIISLDRTLRVRVRRDDVVGRAIFQNGVFEPAEVEFVRRFLQPGSVFIDVGANLGQYTLIGARCVGERGSVHSFEPSTRMFAELEFNVRLNGVSKVCRLNCAALAQTNGAGTLSVHEPGSEVYGSLGSQSWAGRIVGREDVVTVTLDSYLEQAGIAQVDLIKMDIEGAELLALKGARELISGPDAPAILFEIADVNTRGFEYAAVEIWDYLVSLGYRLYELSDGGRDLRPASRRPWWAGDNLVALKRHDR